MRSIRFPHLLLTLLCTLSFSACQALDLNREVDNAEIQQKVAAADAMVGQLQGYITLLQGRLDDATAFLKAQDERISEAKKLADSSQSETAKAVVATLEEMRDRASAEIPQLKDALASVQQQLPAVQDMAAKIKTQADGLAKGGSSPWWYAIGTLLLPVIIKVAQVGSAGIPGVGPVVSMVAEQAITGLWNTMATARLKAQDAQTQARSAALDHQVDVTHQLLAVTDAAKADPILDTAKNAQIAAGVYDTLKPIIAALQVQAQKKAA